MPTADKPDFGVSASSDRTRFLAEFVKQFSDSPQYNAGASQDMLELLGLIERDRNIRDIRWVAYMLATTMWETTCPHKVERPALNRKGKPLHDRKGRRVMVKTRKWLISMAPVEEVGHGKGRRYHEPVKVKLLADGTARVTEHDGDQFSVKSDGTIQALTPGAKLGAKDGGAASPVYDNDDGTEQVYFGRGYVQLTWWANYARAGAAIGRGFDLLVDPEIVKQPTVAYELMSYGMRTGGIFANGNSFNDYFDSTDTDYEGARAMVNPDNHGAEIAKIAQKFEAVLRKAKPSRASPAMINMKLP
jgi:hypothetical protein